MESCKMYYNRMMSNDIINLLRGLYNWLIGFVKYHPELDFQTGANNKVSWISVYRGTSRIFRITANSKGKIMLDAADTYMKIEPELYKNPSEQLFLSLIEKIKTYECQTGKNAGKKTLSRYYDNHREGYYQNAISRRYGICGRADGDLIIVDKEAVIGFCNEDTRNKILNDFSQPYRQIAKRILASEKNFPSKLDRANFGNECDFIALTKSGQLMLMELKDGNDTQKIYLSPFQISMYGDIFNHYDRESNGQFRDVLLEMVRQKQSLGLLNPRWPVPEKITGILTALVIGGPFSKTASEKYGIVRQYVNKYDIATYLTIGNSGELIEMAL